MPKTDIVVELNTTDDKDRELCETILKCLKFTFDATCGDLDCLIRSVPQSTIIPDVTETIGMALARAKKEVAAPGTVTCMYVATRNLIIPWKQRRSYEMVAYIMATVSKRSILSATIETRSPLLPLDVAESLRSQLTVSQSAQPTISLTTDEAITSSRLKKAFSQGLDLAEQFASPRTSPMQ